MAEWINPEFTEAPLEVASGVEAEAQHGIIHQIDELAEKVGEPSKFEVLMATPEGYPVFIERGEGFVNFFIIDEETITRGAIIPGDAAASYVMRSEPGDWLMRNLKDPKLIIREALDSGLSPSELHRRTEPNWALEWQGYPAAEVLKVLESSTPVKIVSTESR